MQKYIFHLATVFGQGMRISVSQHSLMSSSSPSSLPPKKLCHRTPHNTYTSTNGTKQNQKKKKKSRRNIRYIHWMSVSMPDHRLPVPRARVPSTCIWSMKCEHDMILKIELIHDTPVCLRVCVHVCTYYIDACNTFSAVFHTAACVGVWVRGGMGVCV